MIDWTLYPNFTRSEFDCKETGDNGMQSEALALFQKVRETYGKPLTVISGYRSARHNEEVKKASPGAHAQGLAADFMVTNGAERFELVKAAYACGAQGIGIAKSFIHIDVGHATQARPAIWSY